MEVVAVAGGWLCLRVRVRSRADGLPAESCGTEGGECNDGNHRAKRIIQMHRTDIEALISSMFRKRKRCEKVEFEQHM
jgi:hypothetical protein